MAHRLAGVRIGIGLVVVAVGFAGCKAAPLDRPIKTGPVDTGPGSVEFTRKTLEGTWTLASLQAIDANGVARPVKATGQLTYDAFGNMTIKGTVEDAALENTLILDYSGRIIIDTARHEFHAASLDSDQPVDFKYEAPRIGPDKVRRYELTGQTFVVTYLDAAGKPSAIARWQR